MELTKQQTSVLIGTILGDGFLQKTDPRLSPITGSHHRQGKTLCIRTDRSSPNRPLALPRQTGTQRTGGFLAKPQTSNFKLQSELPRAYARGILEFKLRLPVVFLPLMLNVFAYHSLRYPHRRYKIPIRPYPTHTPIHFSQKFKLVPQCLRCI